MVDGFNTTKYIWKNIRYMTHVKLITMALAGNGNKYQTTKSSICSRQFEVIFHKIKSGNKWTISPLYPSPESL